MNDGKRFVYPAWLEQWWMEQSRRALGMDTVYRAMTHLRDPVHRLSDRFLGLSGDLKRDYWQIPASRAAYGLFFFPQMFVRVQAVLREILEYHGWTPSASGPVRIWDLGSGPGAAGLAAVWVLGRALPHRKMEIHALDRSDEPLQVYRHLVELARGRGFNVTLEVHVGDLRAWPTGWQPLAEFDMWLACFSLVEALSPWSLNRWVTWLVNAMQCGRKGSLGVIVEPATRDAAERLERLRDRLRTRSDTLVWSPCSHRAPCPMLRKRRFWCHQVRSWKMPEAVEYLNRTLHREAHVLKYSYLVLGRMPSPRPEQTKGCVGRLVAPLISTKGALLTSICADDGRLHEIRVLTRALNRQRLQKLRAWERGDLIECTPNRDATSERWTVHPDRVRCLWSLRGSFTAPGPSFVIDDRSPPGG